MSDEEDGGASVSLIAHRSHSTALLPSPPRFKNAMSRKDRNRSTVSQNKTFFEVSYLQTIFSAFFSNFIIGALVVLILS